MKENHEMSLVKRLDNLLRHLGIEDPEIPEA